MALPFALATAADDSAATMPEQLLRIEWHNSTNPLNNKRLNRVNLPRRFEVWANSVLILVFLGLSVLDLGPMYATDVRQTDVRQHHRLMPPPIRGGGIKTPANPGSPGKWPLKRRERDRVCCSADLV